MAHLKLEDAFLCIDCKAIGTNPECCMVCTSRAVHPIAKFLNRSTSSVGPMAELTYARLDLVPDMSIGEHTDGGSWENYQWIKRQWANR